MYRRNSQNFKTLKNSITKFQPMFFFSLIKNAFSTILQCQSDTHLCNCLIVASA